MRPDLGGKVFDTEWSDQKSKIDKGTRVHNWRALF